MEGQRKSKYIPAFTIFVLVDMLRIEEHVSIWLF